MNSTNPRNTDPAPPITADELCAVRRLGPLLSDALGDPAWLNVEAELIEGGKSNLTFELTCLSGSAVLRRPPQGPLLPRAHDMAREVTVQQALAPTAVPVPPILFSDTSGDLLGFPFYVMAKVDGHVVRAALPPGYATRTQDRRNLSTALLDTLADIHSVDRRAVGLAEFGRPDGFLARQLRRWGGQWDASKVDDVAEVDRLRGRLEARLPAHSAATLVHGDFRLDNVIMADRPPGGVAAVLDWELSTLGDPLSDLGMFLFYWQEPGESPRRLTPTVTSLPGFLSRDELTEGYATRTGLPLTDVPFYRAFACFKFAVITQGVAARVAGNAMAGQRFGDLGEEIRRTAAEGLALLR